MEPSICSGGCLEVRVGICPGDKNVGASSFWDGGPRKAYVSLKVSWILVASWRKLGCGSPASGLVLPRQQLWRLTVGPEASTWMWREAVLWGLRLGCSVVNLNSPGLQGSWVNNWAPISEPVVGMCLPFMCWTAQVLAYASCWALCIICELYCAFLRVGVSSVSSSHPIAAPATTCYPYIHPNLDQ